MTREYRARKMREYRRRHPGVAEARVRAWQLAHPRKNNEASRASRYSRPISEYHARVRAQANACGICRTKKRPRRLGKLIAWYIDHDHKTGKVRGLLCRDCNTGLGYFRDDAARLEAAALYLRTT